MPLHLGETSYDCWKLLKRHGYLKGRVQQALTEALINSTEPRIWIYIRDFIGQPLPECEETIASQSYASMCYAIDVLHDRFPMGEKVIAEELYNNYPKQYAGVILGLDLKDVDSWGLAYCYVHGHKHNYGDFIDKDKLMTAGEKFYHKLMKKYKDNAKLVASLTPEVSDEA